MAKARIDITARDRTKSAFTSAERSMRSFRRVALSLTASIGGGFLGAAAIKGIVGTAASFEKLQASLKTVTGSLASADTAFNFIKEFAATTPFQLEEVTQAFIKLKALGLDPSADALRAYGNTASAMGKTLDQFIEAVADSATGEFERLKEFGIKAKQQGDSVTFVFRGVSTTVKKTASDIEGYLRKIGNVQFAGAMNEQMKTLDGTTSNLKDAFSQLSAQLADDSGLLSGIKSVTTAITDMIRSFVSGPQKIEALRKKLEDLEKTTTRSGRNRRSGAVGRKSAIAETVEDINDELIKLGGPTGVRLALDRVDSEIEGIETRLVKATNRTKNALNKQLKGLKAEREQLFSELERVELGIDGPSAAASASSSSKGAPAPIKSAKVEPPDIGAAEKAFKKWKSSIIDVGAETDLLSQKIAYLDDQMLAGTLTTEEHRIELEKLTGAQSSFSQELDKTTEETKKVGEGARELGFSFSSAFEKAALDGDKLSDVLQGLARDMAQIVLRQTITAPLAGAVSQGIATQIPQFAGGTTYAPGGISLVGESGPELVNLPKGSQVIPNNKLGGGGTVVNVVNNTSAEAKVQRSNDSTGRELVNIVIGQVSKDIASGGAVAQSLQSTFGLRRQGVVRT